MVMILCLFTIFNEPILRSAVLPGWGEATLGYKGKAESFFLVEGGLWLFYGGLTYFGNRGLDNATAYAVQNASANPYLKDEKYLKNVEKYLNSDLYNEGIEREASQLYPDDLARQQEFIKSNGYFGEDAWAWSSEDDFLIFWEKRKSGRESLRSASFCLGLVLLNRICSVIDVAFFSTRKSDFGIKATPAEIGIFYKF